MKKHLVLAAAMTLAAGSLMAQPIVVFEADFESDQSTSFTVVGEDQGGTADYLSNFTYDYSTHTQTEGAAVTITKAPNSDVADGTQGLRMSVNNTDDAADERATIQAFPDLSGVTEDLSVYTLQFDMWINYNGDALGGSGSTEYGLWGAAVDASAPVWRYSTGGTSQNGFVMGTTGEGGAGNDVEFAEDDGTNTTIPLAFDDVKPNWFGTGDDNHSDASMQSAFPNPPFQTAGAAGKWWITVEMQVNTSSGSVIVFVTPEGESEFLLTSLALEAGVDPSNPFVGIQDIFNSTSGTPADSFVVVDNLQVTVPGPVLTGADEGWNLYQ